MRATPKPLYAEESRLLFGNSHMFALIRAIHTLDDDNFTTRDIVHETGIKSNPLYALLDRLVALGIIEIIGHVPGERTVVYRRTANPLFNAVEHIERSLRISPARAASTALQPVVPIEQLSSPTQAEPRDPEADGGSDLSPVLPLDQIIGPEHTD